MCDSWDVQELRIRCGHHMKIKYSFCGLVFALKTKCLIIITASESLDPMSLLMVLVSAMEEKFVG